MTKEQIEQKIKDLLSKDKRFAGATVKINYKDKQNKAEIKEKMELNKT
ncbi:MAG: hypothetical protein WC149_04335 [Arcobacteraceae bacterium]